MTALGPGQAPTPPAEPARAAPGLDRAAGAVFNERAERLRRRVRNRWLFKAFLLARLPLAAAAGLRLVELDASRCVVRLPGGWRTTNPFRSTYFAAQAMGAEMSTGAPARVLVEGATASVAMLVREVHGVFTKKAGGATFFTFSDVAGMAATIERAARGGEGRSFVARSVGRTADGAVVAEFEIHWSFKKRA